jgi:stage II sporulation protein D (peptidoglycan lytic transglycosylase)
MRALLALLAVIPLAAQITVKVRIDRVTRELPLEFYVGGVLAGESSVFRSDEALKAMAVAARTYAVRLRGRHHDEGFDFCATTHCQRVETDKITPRLQAIAELTEGELLWFEGRPAFTPYTRDCGGRTEEAAAVWPDMAATYLTSRDDGHAAANWQWSGDPARVAETLRHAGLRTPPRVERISVVERTESGRAHTLALSGSGETARISAGSFRFAIGREVGWNTVLSDRYEIRSGTVFIGQGSGHGVGLCQRGADQMGEAGRTYREILAHYYPGTAVGLTGRGLSWQRLGGETVSLLTTRPDQDRGVLALAERAVREVSARTRSTLPRDVEIQVYPDVETFRNATGEPGWVAAHTSGLRIQLQPAGLLRNRGALEQTLRHELLHVAVEMQAAPDLPVWFREGLVVYLEGRAISYGRPVTDLELRQTSDATRARRAYADAAGAVATLVKSHGETIVLEWLKTGLPADVRRASNSHETTKSK